MYVRGADVVSGFSRTVTPICTNQVEGGVIVCP